MGYAFVEMIIAIEWDQYLAKIGGSGLEMCTVAGRAWMPRRSTTTIICSCLFSVNM